MLRKFLLILLLVPMHAWAVYSCNVTVSNVLVYQDGSVNVFHSGRNDFTVICNLATERNQVAPATCAMWTGMLLAIKKKGGTATFYFNGDGSCATMGTYSSAPTPVYVGDGSW
jgi:hypothetical protein